MNARPSFALALALAAGLMGGCGSNGNLTSPGTPPGPADSDQAAILGGLAGTPWLGDDGLYPSDTRASAPAFGVAGATAPIEPLFFWRTITHIERDFDFAFGDFDSSGRPNSAEVAIIKTLRGAFNIAVEPDSNVRMDHPPILSKPLADHWRRRLLFKRGPLAVDDSLRRSAWRLAAVSGVRVTSLDMRACPACKTAILGMRLRAGNREVVIENPFELVPLDRLPAFFPGTPVELTVRTSKRDDVVFLLAGDRQMTLHNNGDGTHTGNWMVPLGPPEVRFRHVGVNALAHGTLFDDQYLYDSDAWIMPYQLGPAVRDSFPL